MQLQLSLPQVYRLCVCVRADAMFILRMQAEAD